MFGEVGCSRRQYLLSPQRDEVRLCHSTYQINADLRDPSGKVKGAKKEKKLHRRGVVGIGEGSGNPFMHTSLPGSGTACYAAFAEEAFSGRSAAAACEESL